MFGLPVNTVQFRSLSEKILFCLLSFMSIVLCNTFFLQTQIDKLFVGVLNGIDQHIQNIKSNITTVDDMEICINKLVKDRNSM